MSKESGVRLLVESEIDAYVSHLAIHDRESATLGDLPYGPSSREEIEPESIVKERALKRWRTSLNEPGWRRAWGLWVEGDLVGSVYLAGGDLKANLHRADMGVGLVRPHRGKGWGTRLVETAIEWAEQQPSILWVDLGVFEGNDAAHAIYKKLGFVECGRTADLFRVDGFSINNIQMTLRVSGA